MEHRETCGMLIKQVQDAVAKKLNNSLRESGLTHVQLGTLIALEHTEGRTLRLKELEKIFHVSQPTVVGVVDRLEEKGLTVSGESPDGLLPEIVELNDHPFFIAVQFHPEFKSRAFEAHPVFKGFIAAALKQTTLI